MLETMLWLIGYQLLGETLATGLHLPIPGSVLGMVLLFLTLCFKHGIPETLAKGSCIVLSHMSLYFVPAGVGVIAYTALLKPYMFPLTIILIGSLLITMLSTAWLLTRQLNRQTLKGEEL